MAAFVRASPSTCSSSFSSCWWRMSRRVGPGRRGACALHVAGGAAGDPGLHLHHAAAHCASGPGTWQSPRPRSWCSSSSRRPIASRPRTRCSTATTSSLHKQAANELAKHPQRTVLTAWPASDELTRPYLGYVKQPLTVVSASRTSPRPRSRAPRTPPMNSISATCSAPSGSRRIRCCESLTFGKRLQERFFDYHEDLSPQAAAGILGGRVTMYVNRNNEWIGLIGIEKVENARLRGTDRTLTH